MNSFRYSVCSRNGSVSKTFISCKDDTCDNVPYQSPDEPISEMSKDQAL